MNVDLFELSVRGFCCSFMERESPTRIILTSTVKFNSVENE